jgi:thymidylate synthase (FAD)
MTDEIYLTGDSRLRRRTSVALVDFMGNDLSVDRAARVSFANENEVRPPEKTERLIKYLARHNHWTPFAHTSITLRMTAPVPIRTQCFKHKQGFVENEESRRYICYVPDVFLPTWREQADSKKQGSGEELAPAIASEVTQLYKNQVRMGILTYEAMIDRGVCEEQARFVLPQGCFVNWYWTGSLSAYARFFKQRTDPHAQKEIQDLARQVGEIIEPLYPLSWKALTE